MEYPWLKVALVKWSYFQLPKSGYCPLPEVSKIKNIHDKVLASAEACCKLVHDLKVDVDLEHLTGLEIARIRGACDVAVVEGLLAPMKTASLTVREEALAAALAAPLSTDSEAPA